MMEAYSLCRVFIPLPKEFYKELADLRPALRSVHEAIRVPDPSAAHITIAKLGYSGQPSIEPLIKIARECSEALEGSSLQVHDIDLFSNKGGSYIHFGVEDPTKAIERFRVALVDRSPDIFSRRHRSLVPHMTVAKHSRNPDLNEEVKRGYFEHEEELKAATAGVCWEFPIGSLRFLANCRTETSLNIVTAKFDMEAAA